jgi:TonB family protein
VRRRTQCKNIIALLDINPTEQTAKNYPYGLGSLLRTIGQKAGVTILSADDRLLGSLDDDGQARTSVFVEYFCQALKAGGGALSLDYIASYLGQILSNQAPGGSDRYISHPILLAAADNPELVKMPLGVAVRNPNSLADIKIGRSLSQVAQSDPALAAHLAQLDRSSSSTQKLEKLKQAQDAADEENASEQEREREKGKPWEKEEKEEGQGENPEVDFAPYMTTMKKTIQGKWGPPKGLDQKTVVAVFSIQKDGSIVDSEIVQSSGNATIDQSALKALADASPLAPLPKGAPKRVQIRYKFDWKASQ